MADDRFYSRLNHFWNTERFTDVTIECGNKNFRCHRLVLAASCEYFDAMFCGQFRERNSNIIPLSGISAETFEQVLKFMYTGHTSIDSGNVCELLQASEFFGLPEIEDLCIQFVEENGVSVQDTLEIFMFACATKKQFLVDIFSVHVADHFEIFSTADSFLKIPFYEFKTILICFTESCMRNEETLLSAITRWIHHNREERMQYFSEFVKMIRFENISSTYVRFMFTKFFLDTHITVLTQTLQPIGYSDYSLLQEGALSVHNANHFEILSIADSFLKIPLFSAIIRWIHHDPEEQLQHFSELIKMIRFENISSTSVQSMFTKFFLDTHYTALTQTFKPIGFSDYTLLQEGAISEPQTSLHVFFSPKKNKFWKVCSINSKQVCSVSNWVPQTNPFQSIRNVALNNFYLYSLHYLRSPPKPEDSFIPEQKFCAYTSVNTPSELRLKSPPVNFDCTYPSLCAIENNIYIQYHHKRERNIVYETKSSEFNEEEINRGICVYNCEVDEWFPVPKMKMQMENACMTAQNNSLYVVGRIPTKDDIGLGGYSQMYDCRTGLWQELPKTYYRYLNNHTVCCSMREKIYVCGKVSANKIQIERYDPIAGRWEGLTRNSSLQRTFLACRLIPFLDKLWLFGSRLPKSSPDVFDVDSCSWGKFSLLDNTNVCVGFDMGFIQDAVVSWCN